MAYGASHFRMKRTDVTLQFVYGSMCGGNRHARRQVTMKVYDQADIRSPDANVVNVFDETTPLC